jgi:DNA helicase-2/ATP-dependent DNA helicase PcrA
MPASNFKSVKSVNGHPPVNSYTSAAKSPAQATVAEGNVIEHERFGIGTVIRLEGNGENMKATVQFRNTGIKQLLLKFARFKVIS